MSFGNVTLQLLKGFSVTCELFILTLLIALPLGLLIAFCSMSRFKIISGISKTFIWIIRGTPLMLQIMVVFYGPSLLFGVRVDRFWAAVAAFGINYAAYFSEIYRGGIEGMAKGQYEACYVLGLNKMQTFTRVIIPQLFKRILAPMSNEIITLVKDTTLVSAIALIEITGEAGKLVSTYVTIWPLFYSGAFYLIFNGMLTLLFGYAERKMKYYR